MNIEKVKKYYIANRLRQKTKKLRKLLRGGMRGARIYEFCFKGQAVETKDYC